MKTLLTIIAAVTANMSVPHLTYKNADEFLSKHNKLLILTFVPKRPSEKFVTRNLTELRSRLYKEHPDIHLYLMDATEDPLRERRYEDQGFQLLLKKNPGEVTTKEKKNDDFVEWLLPFEEGYTSLEKTMKWTNKKISGNFAEKLLCRQIEQKVQENHFNIIYFGHPEGTMWNIFAKMAKERHFAFFHTDDVCTEKYDNVQVPGLVIVKSVGGQEVQAMPTFTSAFDPNDTEGKKLYNQITRWLDMENTPTIMTDFAHIERVLENRKYFFILFTESQDLYRVFINQYMAVAKTMRDVAFFVHPNLAPELFDALEKPKEGKTLLLALVPNQDQVYRYPPVGHPLVPEEIDEEHLRHYVDIYRGGELEPLQLLNEIKEGDEENSYREYADEQGNYQDEL